MRVRVTMYRQERTRQCALRSDNVEVCGNGHVVIGVRIVQCHHAIMDVVIGVRVMQCYHAIMDNCEHVVIGVRVMHCYHALMANS